MDKKDIYEHLANIYLDVSSKKKKRRQDDFKFRNLFFVSISLIIGLSILLFNAFRYKNFNSSQIALVLHHDFVKINFNFDPTQKEIYSIALNKLNLNRYKALAFSAKKTNHNDAISLRIEFNNTFNEKSFVYLRDISHKWKEFTIAFTDFKGITDWSEMSMLSFVMEEWNAKEKKDIVYLDNIRLLR